MTQLITLSSWGGLDTDGLLRGLICICIYNMEAEEPGSPWLVLHQASTKEQMD